MRTITRRAALSVFGATVLAGSACGRGAPAANDRVVTVDGITARIAMLLGRRVDGSAVLFGVDPVIGALSSVQGIRARSVSASDGQLDLERAAAIAPGLIVGFHRPDLDSDRLALLADTRLVELTTDVVSSTRAVGAALGLSDRTRIALERWRATQQATADRLAGRTLPTVSVLTSNLGTGTVTMCSPATAGVATLRALGIQQPTVQAALRADGPAFPPVSGETLADHDADVLVVLVQPGADSSALRTQPLFDGLRAVRAGAVVEVDAFEWAAVSSLMGARWALDDVTEILDGRTAPIRGLDSPDGVRRVIEYRAESGGDR